MKLTNSNSNLQGPQGIHSGSHISSMPTLTPPLSILGGLASRGGPDLKVGLFEKMAFLELWKPTMIFVMVNIGAHTE